MLRQVLPPLVTAYVIFVAMIVLVRRRPVPRPHGRSDRTVRAGAGRFVRTALGGYVAFLVIVLVFHVWLAGERDAFASAVWGGAFLSGSAVSAAAVVPKLAVIMNEPGLSEPDASLTVGPVKTYEAVAHDALKVLPHSGGAIELKHKAPEVTFLGVNDQPDFATLYITMYPQKSVIELKSLKEYLYQWRDVVVSYERFLDVVYAHFMSVYEPVRLRLTLETRPRGGISSKLTIDSDWTIRGGKEEFRDWVGMEDTW